VVRPGLSALVMPTPPCDPRLRRDFDNLGRVLDRYVSQAGFPKLDSETTQMAG
jgi:hypothetical protein